MSFYLFAFFGLFVMLPCCNFWFLTFVFSSFFVFFVFFVFSSFGLDLMQFLKIFGTLMHRLMEEKGNTEQIIFSLILLSLPPAKSFAANIWLNPKHPVSNCTSGSSVKHRAEWTYCSHKNSSFIWSDWPAYLSHKNSSFIRSDWPDAGS